MSESITPSELSDFDMAHHLGSPAAMADYLTAALEEGNEVAVVNALSTMARACATPDALALTADDLNAACRVGVPLQFEVLARACAALGLKLIAQPI